MRSTPSECRRSPSRLLCRKRRNAHARRGPCSPPPSGQVVDEAVFALAEKQPGFAKVFFYLEQEAMKPRYEIHSIGMPQITEPVPLPQAAQRERAARALFAATEMVNNNRFETDFGRTVPQTKYYEYLSRYRT